jgi:transcription initiation factor TFIIB
MIGVVHGESYHMRMLRKYQSWTSMPYKERSLYSVFDTLSISAGNGGIPTSIVTEAKNLYKQASASGVTRGSNRSGLIASSMYVACKRANVPRSAKEMAKMFHIQSSTMTRGCKRFQEIVPMEMGHARPSDFVQRMMSHLCIDKSVRDACVRAVEIVQDMGLVEENSPTSVAATCIFMVCEDLGLISIDKKQVAAACDVSVVTIARCYKKLLPYKDLFIGM